MDDVVQLTDVKLITKALHPFTDADFNPALCELRFAFFGALIAFQPLLTNFFNLLFCVFICTSTDTNSVFSQMDATTELAGVVSNLRATEQSVAQELRLCVDENYPKFIGASAEFACFEIDIINFGTLLRELNSSTKEISERTSGQLESRGVFPLSSQ